MPPALHLGVRFSAARLAQACCAGLGIGLLFIACRIIVSFLPHQAVGNDFAFAYVSGRVVRDGTDPYRTD